MLPEKKEGKRKKMSAGNSTGEQIHWGKKATRFRGGGKFCNSKMKKREDRSMGSKKSTGFKEQLARAGEKITRLLRGKLQIPEEGEGKTGGH